MLDLRFIRDNIEFLQEMLANRGSNMSLEEFEQLDAERRDILTEVEALKYRRNNASTLVATKKKSGEDASEIIAEMGIVSGRIKELDLKLAEVDVKLTEFQMVIPNVYHTSVPVGKGEDENVEVRTWGKPKEFNFEPKSHWEMGEELEILDFERGAKLGGSRFVIYRGMGARLERALINFMLDTHTTE
ncbi:MAG: serine--tRNA ligase, partial [Fusobacteriaceae bacterium]